MNPLMVTILFELLDLGIRLADKPADTERYAELRKKLRDELVAEANRPVTPAPAPDVTKPPTPDYPV